MLCYFVKKNQSQPPNSVRAGTRDRNQGPLDLQSNALPTELFRLTSDYSVAFDHAGDVTIDFQ